MGVALDRKEQEFTVGDLCGERIKEIYSRAQEIAELHGILTSPRGHFFRMELLHELGRCLSENDIERRREKAGLVEYERHLHKLSRFRLVEEDRLSEESFSWRRTDLGEKAINALRELERRIGEESARRIYRANCGVNSIRLFLMAYGDNKEVDFVHREKRYTPSEIGKLCMFLPRTIEGVSASDKLNEAGLLQYKDTENVVCLRHFQGRAFYQYLVVLYEILND
ncbi:MAG: hypothetical protein RX316_10170 [bacterium]|nr:hypothetical protein [bacterium]